MKEREKLSKVRTRPTCMYIHDLIIHEVLRKTRHTCPKQLFFRNISHQVETNTSSISLWWKVWCRIRFLTVGMMSYHVIVCSSCSTQSSIWRAPNTWTIHPPTLRERVLKVLFRKYAKKPHQVYFCWLLGCACTLYTSKVTVATYFL